MNQEFPSLFCFLLFLTQLFFVLFLFFGVEFESVENGSTAKICYGQDNVRSQCARVFVYSSTACYSGVGGVNVCTSAC